MVRGNSRWYRDEPDPTVLTKTPPDFACMSPSLRAAVAAELHERMSDAHGDPRRLLIPSGVENSEHDLVAPRLIEDDPGSRVRPCFGSSAVAEKPLILRGASRRRSVEHDLLADERVAPGARHRAQGPGHRGRGTGRIGQCGVRARWRRSDLVSDPWDRGGLRDPCAVRARTFGAAGHGEESRGGPPASNQRGPLRHAYPPVAKLAVNVTSVAFPTLSSTPPATTSKV